jgi:hypothetical protein
VENCKDVASIEKFMTRVVLESKSGESKKWKQKKIRKIRNKN